MELFNLLRPRDINVESCVDAVPNQMRDFFLFDSPALNTASSEEADRAVRAGRGKVVARHSVQAVTLPGLLDQHLPPGQRIDFLSIDVEGLDEVILRSHDFTRYRPRVLVFERKDLDPLGLGQDPLIAELYGRGYAFGCSSRHIWLGRWSRTAGSYHCEAAGVRRASIEPRALGAYHFHRLSASFLDRSSLGTPNCPVGRTNLVQPLHLATALSAP